MNLEQLIQQFRVDADDLVQPYLWPDEWVAQWLTEAQNEAAIRGRLIYEAANAAVSQIAAKNGVPCVILRAMSDNADEDGHEVLVVKKFSIAEYVATATKIVAAMVEAL